MKPPRPELIALLAACKDEPDDAPRLVLADWLEEYGDEHDRARAEFVRLQVEADGDDLSPRERELLRVHGPAWLWPIMDVFCRPLSTGGAIHHDRGLLHVEAPVSKLAEADEQGDLAGREQWAWVQALTLIVLRAAPVKMLRGSPLLAGVTELHLSGAYDSTTFHEMLYWTLDRLRVLDLGDSGMTGFDVLLNAAGWTALQRLRVLRVSGSTVKDRGLRAMLDLQLPGRLQELTATNSQLSAAGAAALADSWLGRQLRRLDLSDTPLGPEGVRGLLAGGLHSLTHLRLDGTQAGDDGVKAIAERPWPGDLRRLHLVENGISSGGAMYLARSPHLQRLTSLDLAYNEISGLGAHLTASPMLAGLTSLNLGANRLGPRWARALARTKNRLGLRTLLLFDNAIGPDGARALAACDLLSGIRELDLSGNGLGDEGCEGLSKARLPNLTYLDLRGNGITDRGAVALASSPLSPRELRLNDNAIGDEGRRALAERFGAGVVDLLESEPDGTAMGQT